MLKLLQSQKIALLLIYKITILTTYLLIFFCAKKLKEYKNEFTFIGIIFNQNIITKYI